MLIKTKDDVREFVQGVWERILGIKDIFLLNSNKNFYLQEYSNKNCKPFGIAKNFTSLFQLDVFCNHIYRQDDVIDEIWEEVKKHEKAI